MPDAPPASRKPRAKRPIWLAALAALVTFVAVFGSYLREHNEVEAYDAPTAPGGLFREDQSRGTSLTAVGRVAGFPVPCTAWLLDTGAESATAAYAVMAGRCVGIGDSATVISNNVAYGTTIDFNTFASLTTAEYIAPVTAPVDEVVWASTRGTDLAVVRLGLTYGELEGGGVRAISPAAAVPEGVKILVAGVPVEGISDDQLHVRGSSCTAGISTDVAEGPWIFKDMGASDCTGILEGSAGSPVFNPAGQAVGMIATTTIGAEEGPDCAAGRPCEVADGSLSMRQNTSYIVAVDVLAQCFEQGRFTLGGSCALEDPATLVGASVASASASAGAPVDVRITGAPATPVSVKSGTLAATDCWDPAGWAPATASGDGTLTVDMPSEEGPAVICVGSAVQPTPIRLSVTGPA